MKTKTVTYYVCESCFAEYKTMAECTTCEAKPVSQDRGVKVGDEVVITGGDGTGKRLKVENKFVITKDWGHYAWKTYWHTVALSGPVIGSYGSRMLTFNQYEVPR